MNNDQFRRLLFDNPNPHRPESKSTSSTSTSPPTESHDAQTPKPLLGSRMRSSIPMTPRSVTKPDFARQLAEYRREAQPPAKRFRSSAAPKGTKLPSGYRDRAAQLRGESEGGDGDGDGDGNGDGEKDEEVRGRLRELEEQFKKGVIGEERFSELRRGLGVGGDVGSTHMVKGLDWDLLRRVRAGEDISRVEKDQEDQTDQKDQKDQKDQDEVGDVDEEFDRVLDGKEDQELPSAPREKEKKKKGSMAAPVQRKTRDEILKELRASRTVAPQPPTEPALGGRFKRIGESNKVEKKRWIEQDENGRRREVLVITDAEGKTKRKTRWLDKPGESLPLPAPDKDAKPLGMEVPVEVLSGAHAEDKEENDDDDDIFAGVGADYDPLADMGSDSDYSSDSDEDGEVQTTAEKAPTTEPEAKEAVTKPRNYFATRAREEEAAVDRSNPLTKDPVLLAALKRAAALRQASPSEEEGVDSDTLLRRKKFLEEARRREALDAMDLDLGFGGSRMEDDEDDEAVVLEHEGGSKKRKRGPKKKKGDKNSASDVLRVLEGRKTDR